MGISRPSQASKSPETRTARARRRPDRERDAIDAVHGSRVCSEHVIQPLVRPLADEVQVDLAQRRQEPIRIVALPGVAVGELEAQAVVEARGRRPGREAGPDAAAHLLHRVPLARGQHRCGRGIRMERTDQQAVLDRVHAEHGVRIMMLAAPDARRIVRGRRQQVEGGSRGAHRSNHTLRLTTRVRPEVWSHGRLSRGACARVAAARPGTALATTPQHCYSRAPCRATGALEPLEAAWDSSTACSASSAMTSASTSAQPTRWSPSGTGASSSVSRRWSPWTREPSVCWPSVPRRSAWSGGRRPTSSPSGRCATA